MLTHTMTISIFVVLLILRLNQFFNDFSNFKIVKTSRVLKFIINSLNDKLMKKLNKLFKSVFKIDKNVTQFKFELIDKT